MKIKRKKSRYSLDSLISEQEEREKKYEMRDVSTDSSNKKQKIRIGTVEKYFQKIKVAAIKIENEDLKINDIIEIGDEEDAIRQKVRSMQINKVDVESAETGDSVGISLNYPVKEGSNVFKIIKN